MDTKTLLETVAYLREKEEIIELRSARELKNYLRNHKITVRTYDDLEQIKQCYNAMEKYLCGDGVLTMDLLNTVAGGALPFGRMEYAEKNLQHFRVMTDNGTGLNPKGHSAIMAVVDIANSIGIHDKAGLNDQHKTTLEQQERERQMMDPSSGSNITPQMLDQARENSLYHAQMQHITPEMLKRARENLRHVENRVAERQMQETEKIGEDISRTKQPKDLQTLNEEAKTSGNVHDVRRANKGSVEPIAKRQEVDTNLQKNLDGPTDTVNSVEKIGEDVSHATLQRNAHAEQVKEEIKVAAATENDAMNISSMANKHEIRVDVREHLNEPISDKETFFDTYRDADFSLFTREDIGKFFDKAERTLEINKYLGTKELVDFHNFERHIKSRPELKVLLNSAMDQVLEFLERKVNGDKSEISLQKAIEFGLKGGNDPNDKSDEGVNEMAPEVFHMEDATTSSNQEAASEINSGENSPVVPIPGSSDDGNMSSNPNAKLNNSTGSSPGGAGRESDLTFNLQSLSDSPGTNGTGSPIEEDIGEWPDFSTSSTSERRMSESELINEGFENKGDFYEKSFGEDENIVILRAKVEENEIKFSILTGEGTSQSSVFNEGQFTGACGTVYQENFKAAIKFLNPYYNVGQIDFNCLDTNQDIIRFLKAGLYDLSADENWKSLKDNDKLLLQGENGAWYFNTYDGTVNEGTVNENIVNLLELSEPALRAINYEDTEQCGFYAKVIVKYYLGLSEGEKAEFKYEFKKDPYTTLKTDKVSTKLENVSKTNGGKDGDFSELVDKINRPNSQSDSPVDDMFGSSVSSPGIDSEATTSSTVSSPGVDSEATTSSNASSPEVESSMSSSPSIELSQDFIKQAESVARRFGAGTINTQAVFGIIGDERVTRLLNIDEKDYNDWLEKNEESLPKGFKERAIDIFRILNKGSVDYASILQNSNTDGNYLHEVLTVIDQIHIVSVRDTVIKEVGIFGDLSYHTDKDHFAVGIWDTNGKIDVEALQAILKDENKKSKILGIIEGRLGAEAKANAEGIINEILALQPNGWFGTWGDNGKLRAIYGSHLAIMLRNCMEPIRFREPANAFETVEANGKTTYKYENVFTMLGKFLGVTGYKFENIAKAGSDIPLALKEYFEAIAQYCPELFEETKVSNKNLHIVKADKLLPQLNEVVKVLKEYANIDLYIGTENGEQRYYAVRNNRLLFECDRKNLFDGNNLFMDLVFGLNHNYSYLYYMTYCKDACKSDKAWWVRHAFGIRPVLDNGNTGEPTERFEKDDHDQLYNVAKYVDRKIQEKLVQNSPEITNGFNAETFKARKDCKSMDEKVEFLCACLNSKFKADVQFAIGVVKHLNSEKNLEEFKEGVGNESNDTGVKNYEKLVEYLKQIIELSKPYETYGLDISEIKNFKEKVQSKLNELNEKEPLHEGLLENTEAIYGQIHQYLLKTDEKYKKIQTATDKKQYIDKNYFEDKNWTNYEEKYFVTLTHEQIKGLKLNEALNFENKKLYVQVDELNNPSYLLAWGEGKEQKEVYFKSIDELRQTSNMVQVCDSPIEQKAIDEAAQSSEVVKYFRNNGDKQKAIDDLVKVLNNSDPKNTVNREARIGALISASKGNERGKLNGLFKDENAREALNRYISAFEKALNITGQEKKGIRLNELKAILGTAETNCYYDANTSELVATAIMLGTAGETELNVEAGENISAVTKRLLEYIDSFKESNVDYIKKLNWYANHCEFNEETEDFFNNVEEYYVFLKGKNEDVKNWLKDLKIKIVERCIGRIEKREVFEKVFNRDTIDLFESRLIDGKFELDFKQDIKQLVSQVVKGTIQGERSTKIYNLLINQVENVALLERISPQIKACLEKNELTATAQLARMGVESTRNVLTPLYRELRRKNIETAVANPNIDEAVKAISAYASTADDAKTAENIRNALDRVKKANEAQVKLEQIVLENIISRTGKLKEDEKTAIENGKIEHGLVETVRAALESYNKGNVDREGAIDGITIAIMEKNQNESEENIQDYVGKQIDYYKAIKTRSAELKRISSICEPESEEQAEIKAQAETALENLRNGLTQEQAIIQIESCLSSNRTEADKANMVQHLTARINAYKERHLTPEEQKKIEEAGEALNKALKGEGSKAKDHVFTVDPMGLPIEAVDPKAVEQDVEEALAKYKNLNRRGRFLIQTFTMFEPENDSLSAEVINQIICDEHINFPPVDEMPGKYSNLYEFLYDAGVLQQLKLRGENIVKTKAKYVDTWLELLEKPDVKLSEDSKINKDYLKKLFENLKCRFNMNDATSKAEFATAFGEAQTRISEALEAEGSGSVGLPEELDSFMQFIGEVKIDTQQQAIERMLSEVTEINRTEGAQSSSADMQQHKTLYDFKTELKEYKNKVVTNKGKLKDNEKTNIEAMKTGLIEKIQSTLNLLAEVGRGEGIYASFSQSDIHLVKFKCAKTLEEIENILGELYELNDRRHIYKLYQKEFTLRIGGKETKIHIDAIREELCEPIIENYKEECADKKLNNSITTQNLHFYNELALIQRDIMLDNVAHLDTSNFGDDFKFETHFAEKPTFTYNMHHGKLRYLQNSQLDANLKQKAADYNKVVTREHLLNKLEEEEFKNLTDEGEFVNDYNKRLLREKDCRVFAKGEENKYLIISDDNFIEITLESNKFTLENHSGHLQKSLNQYERFDTCKKTYNSIFQNSSWIAKTWYSHSANSLIEILYKTDRDISFEGYKTANVTVHIGNETAKIDLQSVSKSLEQLNQKLISEPIRKLGTMPDVIGKEEIKGTEFIKKEDFLNNCIYSPMFKKMLTESLTEEDARKLKNLSNFVLHSYSRDCVPEYLDSRVGNITDEIFSNAEELANGILTGKDPRNPEDSTRERNEVLRWQLSTVHMENNPSAYREDLAMLQFMAVNGGCEPNILDRILLRAEINKTDSELRKDKEEYKFLEITDQVLSKSLEKLDDMIGPIVDAVQEHRSEIFAANTANGQEITAIRDAMIQIKAHSTKDHNQQSSTKPLSAAERANGVKIVLSKFSKDIIDRFNNEVRELAQLFEIRGAASENALEKLYERNMIDISYSSGTLSTFITQQLEKLETDRFTLNFRKRRKIRNWKESAEALTAERTLPENQKISKLKEIYEEMKKEYNEEVEELKQTPVSSALVHIFKTIMTDKIYSIGSAITDSPQYQIAKRSLKPEDYEEGLKEFIYNSLDGLIVFKNKEFKDYSGQEKRTIINPIHDVIMQNIPEGKRPVFVGDNVASCNRLDSITSISQGDSITEKTRKFHTVNLLYNLGAYLRAIGELRPNMPNDEQEKVLKSYAKLFAKFGSHLKEYLQAMKHDAPNKTDMKALTEFSLMANLLYLVREDYKGKPVTVTKSVNFEGLERLKSPDAGFYTQDYSKYYSNLITEQQQKVSQIQEKQLTDLLDAEPIGPIQVN